MPTTQLRLALAIAATVIVLPWPMCAQDSPCSQTPGVNVMLGSEAIGMPGRHAAPYTGKVRTTFEQKLADGNTIHSSSEVREARDSEGRWMTERQMGCAPGSDGQMHPLTFVNVNDPVAHTSMNWTEGDDLQPKVVHVFHQPQPQTPIQKQELTPEQQEQRQKMLEALQTRAQDQRADTRTEQLGTKTIAGIGADGFRTTRTIPAGAQGNDLPMEIVNETWRSKDLGLTLMRINDDPRRGRTTAEYIELQQGEPDPALFNPPAGYTIEEQTLTGNVTGGIIGSTMNP